MTLSIPHIPHNFGQRGLSRSSMLYQEQEVSGNPDPVTLMSYYLSGRKGSLNRTYTPSMINNNNKELTLMLFYFLNTDPSNKKVIVINTVL